MAKQKKIKSSKNKAQMDDAELAENGKKYKSAQRREATAKKAKEDLRDLIKPELVARGTRSLETNGVKITHVTPEEVVYNWDKLRKRLSKKQLRRIQVDAVDRQKLAEAIEDGIVDAADVEQCSEIVQKSGYINVSIQSPRARKTT